MESKFMKVGDLVMLVLWIYGMFSDYEMKAILFSFPAGWLAGGIIAKMIYRRSIL